MIFRHLRPRRRLRKRELSEDDQDLIDWTNGLLVGDGELSSFDVAALLADMEPPCEVDDEIPKEWIEEAERGYNICLDCKTVGSAEMCPKCGKSRLWEPPEEIIEELGDPTGDV